MGARPHNNPENGNLQSLLKQNDWWRDKRNRGDIAQRAERARSEMWVEIMIHVKGGIICTIEDLAGLLDGFLEENESSKIFFSLLKKGDDPDIALLERIILPQLNALENEPQEGNHFLFAGQLLRALSQDESLRAIHRNRKNSLRIERKKKAKRGKK